MPLKPCSSPGCPELAPLRQRYCLKHGANNNWQITQAHRSHAESQRTSTGRWRKLRAVILQRDNHLCQVCLAAGTLTPAREADHIIPVAQGGTDDSDNLQSICRACHRIKTAREH